MKILSVCIPTYKRRKSLRRCIESVVEQIIKYDFSNEVSIYVADDASPDDTLGVLTEFNMLDYFSSISRKDNLGMNVNIKNMLNEVKDKSKFQLIITDDDFLQPEALKEIIDFLRDDNTINDTPAIWTPRYSYTEDDLLHVIICNPFKENAFVKATATNTGRYMINGFVLSGLIIRSEFIDFKFWEKYTENAYFPVIFFADLLFRYGAYYWDKNIVHHTVLNECHWQSWGRSDILIEFKKFSDFVNAYVIFSEKIKGRFELVKYYMASFSSICDDVSNLMHSDSFNNNRTVILDAISEQKINNVVEFETPLRQILFLILFFNSIVGLSKFVSLRVLLLFVRDKIKKEYYTNRSLAYMLFLQSVPYMIKLIR